MEVVRCGYLVALRESSGLDKEPGKTSLDFSACEASSRCVVHGDTIHRLERVSDRHAMYNTVWLLC